MRIIRFLALIALTFALLAVGFWFGFRQGTYVGVMVNAIPRGSISMWLLGPPEQRLTKNTLTLIESDVDVALLSAHSIEEHPLYALFEPVWGLPISQSKLTLKRLASYRQSHPSPLREEALALEPLAAGADAGAVRAELLADAKKNDKIVSSMVARYGAVTSPTK